MSNPLFRSRSSKKAGVEFKRPGSNEFMVGAGGEINASSKAELMQQISALINAHETGQVLSSTEEKLATSKERQAALASAFSDRSSGSWSELGASIAGELSETADREGFMRRIIKKEEVSQGQVPRIRVRTKTTTSVVAAGAGSIFPSYARDKYFYPPEFTISSNVRVEHREMNQGTGDILQEKFLESQEAIMVSEDKTLLKMVNNLVNLYNPLQNLVGGLTPQNFVYMRSLISDWNIPVTTVLMSSNYWNDIVANKSFGEWFDPVSKYEIISNGYLGSLLGLSLITDAYRHPNLKVLNKGDLYMFGDAENLGAYTERGPVQSVDVNNYDKGEPARGWYLYEELSMLVFNARALVKGVRA